MEVQASSLASSLVPVGQRSRKQIAPFDLHQPKSLADAVTLWRSLGPNAALLAGGIDLVNSMKLGRQPVALIDLRAVAELRKVETDTDGGAFLGAMVTHRELAAASAGTGALADLARLWSTIGNPRVRHKGTLAGNIMARNPNYDLMPCLLALDAQLVVIGADGSTCNVPARSGPLDPGSFVLGIRLASRASRLLVERSHKPVISVALSAQILDGHVDALAIALGCLGDSPPWAQLRLDRPLECTHMASQAPALAERLVRALPAATVGQATHGSYPAHLAGVITRRLIVQLGAPHAST